jgi:putative copper resistance protein D
VHSWYLRRLGHPVIASALFLGSLVLFYSSSLFELSLRSHTAHQVMVAHFLLTGYLFASAIVGIDPGGTKLAYPFRCVTLLVVFGAHALYSVSLIGSTRILGEEWFTALGRTCGGTLLSDQSAGATLGWVLGDYPIAILGGALIWSWVHADMREARRYDRQAVRDDDDELRRYNQQLARLNRRT